MKKWKQTAGFTLVELIVVIAILGILAGVGTVGYSGYIKKANMTADKQLVADLVNGLQLEYYSAAGSGAYPNGMIALTNDEPAFSGNLVNAVNNMYGQADGLKLKYKGWGGYDGNLTSNLLNIQTDAQGNVISYDSDTGLLGVALNLSEQMSTVLKIVATSDDLKNQVGDSIQNINSGEFLNGASNATVNKLGSSEAMVSVWAQPDDLSVLQAMMDTNSGAYKGFSAFVQMDQSTVTLGTYGQLISSIKNGANGADIPDEDFYQIAAAFAVIRARNEALAQYIGNNPEDAASKNRISGFGHGPDGTGSIPLTYTVEKAQADYNAHKISEAALNKVKEYYSSSSARSDAADYYDIFGTTVSGAGLTSQTANGKTTYTVADGRDLTDYIYDEVVSSYEDIKDKVSGKDNVVTIQVSSGANGMTVTVSPSGAGQGVAIGGGASVSTGLRALNTITITESGQCIAANGSITMSVGEKGWIEFTGDEYFTAELLSIGTFTSSASNIVTVSRANSRVILTAQSTGSATISVNAGEATLCSFVVTVG